MSPAVASSSAIAKAENYLYFDLGSANAQGSRPVAAQAPAQLPAASSEPGMPGSLAGPGRQASFGQGRQKM